MLIECFVLFYLTNFAINESVSVVKCYDIVECEDDCNKILEVGSDCSMKEKKDIYK